MRDNELRAPELAPAEASKVERRQIKSDVVALPRDDSTSSLGARANEERHSSEPVSEAQPSEALGGVEQGQLGDPSWGA
jgi:hypothetical protein